MIRVAVLYDKTEKQISIDITFYIYIYMYVYIYIYIFIYTEGTFWDSTGPNKITLYNKD